VNPSGYVTGEKIEFFYPLTPDFDGFGFLPHTEGAVNKKKLKLGQNKKLVVVAIEPISMPIMCFLENFEVLVIL
jgi:hypothetical protein